MKPLTKTTNRLTFTDIRKIERATKSYPGFDVRIEPDMQDELTMITHQNARSLSVKEGIPNDIIVNDRVPAPDMYLREVMIYDDPDKDSVHSKKIEKVRCRVVMFNRIDSKKTNLPKEGEFTLMGAIIVDYGIAFPMRLFGIRHGSDKIEILDKLTWFMLTDLKDRKKCEARYKDEYPTVEYMYKILNYWYGCQKVILKREKYPRLWKIINASRVRHLCNMVKRYDTELKYDKKTNRGAKKFSPSLQSWATVGYEYEDERGNTHYIPGKRHYRKPYAEFEAKGLVVDN